MHEIPLETDHYRLRVRPGSPDLVLVFSGLAPGIPTFDYERSMADSAASVLYTNYNTPEWVEGRFDALLAALPETMERIRRLAARAGATRLHAFGASFGGYTAVLLGTLLGARRIVAMSADLEPLPGSRFERLLRGRDLGGPHLRLGDLLRERPGPDVHLLFGERDLQDTLAALHVLDAPGVALHPFRGADHHMPSWFARQGALPALAGRFFEPGFDFAALPHHAPSRWTAEAAARLREGFDAQAAHDNPRAEAAYEAVSKAVPKSPLGWQRLGIARLARRRILEATAAFREALARDATDPRTLAGLAEALYRGGEREAGMRACEEGLALAPGWTQLRKLREWLLADAERREALERERAEKAGAEKAAG